MKKVFFLALALAVVAVSLCPPAFCEDNAGTKLGRGLANIFTGWIEFPSQIGKEIEKRGDIAAAFTGPVIGLWKAIERTAVGFYETLTFPIPVPPDYRPIMEPEFVMQTGRSME